MSSNRPKTNEIRSVYNYLTDIDPVHDDEQQYILWKEDLLTLRPGRDHAWLDRGIEKCLQVLQTRVPYIQVGNVGLETGSELLLIVLRKSSHPVLVIETASPVLWKADFYVDNQRESVERPSNILHPRANQHMRKSGHHDGDRRTAHHSDLFSLHFGEG
jgi:hypothetical protein